MSKGQLFFVLFTSSMFVAMFASIIDEPKLRLLLFVLSGNMNGTAVGALLWRKP